MHNQDVEKRESKEPVVKSDDSPKESTAPSKPSFQYAYKKRVPFFKKKTCIICQRSLELELEYKNVALLRRFVSERGKILPRRLTGNCMRHQRFATRAIKQARVMALLWFV